MRSRPASCAGEPGRRVGPGSARPRRCPSQRQHPANETGSLVAWGNRQWMAGRRNWGAGDVRGHQNVAGEPFAQCCAEGPGLRAGQTARSFLCSGPTRCSVLPAPHVVGPLTVPAPDPGLTCSKAFA